MTEPHERLQKARKDSGFTEATEAARAFNWNIVTYLAHENGTRGLRPAVAEKYGKALRVPAEWILYGRGRRGAAAEKVERVKNVPLVGFVGAGATAHYFSDQGHLDEVAAQGDVTEETVAVEIRGDSLGSFFDRWIVYYDDVRRPITADLIGQLCVVGLADGRILIKKIQKSKTRGMFHLLSQLEPPILDVAVEWAARVKSMVPR